MLRLLDRGLALIGLQRVTNPAAISKDEFAAIGAKWRAEYAELKRGDLVVPRNIVFSGTTNRP